MEKIGHNFKHTAHCYISHVHTNENFGKTLHEANLGSPFVKKKSKERKKSKFNEKEQNFIKVHKPCFPTYMFNNNMC